MFSGFAGEIFVRLIVHNKIDIFHQKLRRPKAYATFDDDDYWKLHVKFHKKIPPEGTHPTLGWVNKVDPETYRHYAAKHIRNRTPVLLYGDSFAECVADKCFEDILNEDPAFSMSHYLLNHGQGGYGVDQIALLYERTIGIYVKPMVVLSLMTLDMDRSVLSFRLRQKPFFAIRNGDLMLEGTPVNPDQAKYLEENPPRIRSYLWRLFIHSKLLPARLRWMLKGKQKLIDYKIRLNQKILERLIFDLRARDTRFVFLIFHPHFRRQRLDGPDTWRDTFLKNFLDNQGVPYIWTKSIITADATSGNRDLSDYFLAGNNHPTELCNRLIANEIKLAVLGDR